MKDSKKTLITAIIISLLVSSVAGMSAGFLGAIWSSRFLQQLENFGLKLPEKTITKKTAEKAAKKQIQYIPQTTEEGMIVDVVKKAQDAVVSIIASKDLPVIEKYYIDPFGGSNDSFGNFFNPFLIPQYREKGKEKKQVSSGTGFIISSNGMILTNKHVVSAEDVEYTVLMNNGSKYPATVLAKDPAQDVALVKIEKEGLTSLTLSDSDLIQTGQTVIAIGNALGEFQNTVSVGVISGLKRTIIASSGFGQSELLEEIIQTDAAINNGNSGGPLLNLKGEVIGMNTAIAQGAQNIGFAISINSVKKDVEEVKKTGKITTPFLGVRYILITEELKKKNNLSVDYGALILRGENREDLAVVPGSPADKAGIVENDIVLEIDGKKITPEYTLSQAVRSKKTGDEITLKILSKGEEKILKVVLEERK